jgi:hypothetical protein
MELEELVEGQYYFQITYPERTFTRPIIGSYEYLGTEEMESDDPKKEEETYYIFEHHPAYRNKAFEENRIAYTTEQVRQLSSIVGLKQELGEIIERQAHAEKNA